MTALILTFAADYGLPLLLVVTFLSCLALPVPSSLLMLASGGFAAAGDLNLPTVMLAAFIGAVLGDNLGYFLAYRFQSRFANWLGRSPTRASLQDRATRYMARHGGLSVFLSRWLVAPLGPYINYVAGLSRLPWPRFALWAAAGECIWVMLYVGLGYAFADHISAIATLSGNLSGLLVMLVIAGALIVWLLRASRTSIRIGRLR